MPSPTYWMVCAHLLRCSPSQMLTFSDQIATPCRHNDLIEELASIQQELDRAKQELSRTKQELQASSESNIVLSQQLGVTQDHLRAAERSRDDYRAQLQQVGLPLCSAGRGLSSERPGLRRPASAVGQRALAPLRQSMFAPQADCSWAGAGVLTAVLLGLLSGVEAVLCGAQRHSTCGVLLDMHCFRH